MMRNEGARCEEKSPNPGLPLADVVYSLTLRVNWAIVFARSLGIQVKAGSAPAGWRADAAAAADFLKGECRAELRLRFPVWRAGWRAFGGVRPPRVLPAEVTVRPGQQDLCRRRLRLLFDSGTDEGTKAD